MTTQKTFTGRIRQRRTSWAVRAGDVIARCLITIGGIGTIIAVSVVCVFLLWVVYPLFLPTSVSAQETVNLSWQTKKPLRLGVDEYQLLGWVLSPDGALHVFRLDNGQVVHRQKLFQDQELTAISRPDYQDGILFGFKDATVRHGKIRFTTDFPTGAKLPAALQTLPIGGTALHNGGLVQRLSEGQWRLQKVTIESSPPISGIADTAIARIDHISLGNELTCCALSTDGKVSVAVLTEKKSLTTRKVTYNLESSRALPSVVRVGKGLPSFLLVSSQGDNVYVAWEDGQLIRFNTADPERPMQAEVVNLLNEEGLTLTALEPLIGRVTLLAGDSSGRIRGWFRTARGDVQSADGQVLTDAHTLPSPPVAVTSLGVSDRTRMIAAGYADGRIRLFYVTNNRLLLEGRTGYDQPIDRIVISPKDDGLTALTSSGLVHWQLDVGHPEITFRSLFRPVWYEGDPAPSHTWQSTSGTDSFEPKFGLLPLVFGTLKATFYSLLIGVPLALLGAVYTSEFLHPRAKTIIKPTIELMASLPSVVLGFLAALVIAPFVARFLPPVLTSFLTLPMAFLLGAYIWQLLPDKWSLRLARWRFFFICLVLPPGILAAVFLGPVFERALFEGNLKAWLNGNVGSSTSGWLVLVLPVSAVGTAYLLSRVINPWLRRSAVHWSRTLCAVVDMGKFLLVALVATAVAFVMALVFNAFGLDPRNSIFSRYENRNALVVGVMMGFAIIPIIYTVAEDALSAVPESLRAASLGCGATPWQTANRIIVPTAMSGMFSAVMIGVGRAVGETMIVLMAAGNTPVMDWNIFNGLRTLSANIAVELPETPVNSTHYRTLFLAALTLFALTFVLNTVAEIVRQRFRRRAYQL